MLERHKCSLGRQFENLKSEVEKSTKKRDEQLARNDGRTFRLELGKDSDEFHVIRQHSGHKTVDVTFELKSDQIHVSGEDLSLVVTLTLNNDGECMYLISKDDKKMEGEFK